MILTCLVCARSSREPCHKVRTQHGARGERRLIPLSGGEAAGLVAVKGAMEKSRLYSNREAESASEFREMEARG